MASNNHTTTMNSLDSIYKRTFTMRTGFDSDYYKNQTSYNEHTIFSKKTKKYYPQAFTETCSGHTYFRTRGTYVDTGDIVDISVINEQ